MPFYIDKMRNQDIKIKYKSFKEIELYINKNVYELDFIYQILILLKELKYFNTRLEVLFDKQEKFIFDKYHLDLLYFNQFQYKALSKSINSKSK